MDTTAMAAYGSLDPINKKSSILFMIIIILSGPAMAAHGSPEPINKKSKSYSSSLSSWPY
jgi:hypothetical protein